MRANNTQQQTPTGSRGQHGALLFLCATLALIGYTESRVTAQSAQAEAAQMQSQDLPQDPRFVRGTLDSGVSYIVLEHDNPPKRATVWLHIDTGSLNELDSQRGIAHFLEHMAFNGSENFPPGTVVPFFEQLGLTFGRHQNAATGFADTRYTLSLPDNSMEMFNKGLLFLSDVAGRLTLPAEEIENERGIILEEKRTRLGAQNRIFEKILENISPGSRFGQRLPIGTEERIANMDRDDFAAYYDKWYVPENMTVLAVGNMPAADMVEAIKAQFSGAQSPWPKRVALDTKPEPIDAGVTTSQASRAVVLTDPELQRASVMLARVDPPRGAITTTIAYRDDLVRTVGTMTFNRRVSAMIANGVLSALSASASSADLFEALEWTQSEVSGEPEQWPALIEQLATELQRARLHGFTQREIDDTVASFIAIAEAGVRNEQDLHSRAILSMLAAKVGINEPIMSAQQHLDLMREYLPKISKQEIDEAFTHAFDFSTVDVTLQLPDSIEQPSEDTLLGFTIAALDTTPEPIVQQDRPSEILPVKPSPGTIVGELETHDATQVNSFWLSNGVRVHHRFMDTERDRVVVRVVLAGGKIHEDSTTHGLTDAAAVALQRPATDRLTSVNLRDLLSGTTVRGRAMQPGDDVVIVEANASPVDVETAMEFLHVLLTDPKIEEATFDNWKTIRAQLIDRSTKEPQAMIGKVLFGTLYPKDDVRTKPIDQEALDTLTIERAQPWLDHLVQTAPIEATIVGNISLDDAKELATQYLATLPKRDRISDTTLNELRQVPQPDWSCETEVTVDTVTLQSVVVVGFFGTDDQHSPDARALEIAAQIMTTRLTKRVREELQLVYGMQAASSPAAAYPGYGMFLAFAPSTEPSKATSLADEVRTMFKAFADEGPTPEEVEIATVQLANIIDENDSRTGFWVGRLSQIDYRGRTLDDVSTEADAFRDITAQQVHETFAKYFNQSQPIRLLIGPMQTDEKTTEEQGR